MKRIGQALEVRSTFAILLYFHAVACVKIPRAEKVLNFQAMYKVVMRVTLILHRTSRVRKAVMGIVYLGTWNSFVQPYLFYNKRVAQFQVL